MDPQANTPQTRRRPFSYELAGVVAVVLVVIVVAAYPRRHVQTPTSNGLTNGAMLAVPDSYSDFSGQILTVQDQRVVIRTSSYDRQGRLTTKSYDVLITDATAIAQSSSVNQVVDTKPIALAELKPNDRVVVFGDVNLATVTSFTATKLIRYQP